MNLFGCRFFTIDQDGSKKFDRKNFDSLLWATITVFQVCFLIKLKFALDQIKHLILKDYYSRRLERGTLQWNGKDFILGFTLFYFFNDVWKLYSNEFVGCYYSRLFC
jgi:hypothetical protein